MANICFFKGIVKGKERNCESFLDIFPCYDILDTKEYCNEEEYAIAFSGTCPWCICAYAKNEENVSKLSDEKIEYITDDDAEEFENYTLKDLSILFDLEIIINSMGEEYEKEYFHYDKGIEIKDKVLTGLKISKNEIDDDEELSIEKINLKSIFESKNTKCNNIKFVITGDLNKFSNRNELISAIENMGGEVSSSVSKNTNYLICNDKNSNTSKLKKAYELGIEIITEEELINKFMDE